MARGTRPEHVSIALLLATLAASARQPPSGSAAPYQDAVFRSRVDLVVLTVTVERGAGGYVDELQQGDFRVFEDGVRQEISFFGTDAIPLDLVLVVDGSGSMAGALPVARAAALRLARRLRPEDRAAVYSFGRRATLRQALTRDVGAVGHALGAIGASGDTALFDGVNVALNEFSTTPDSAPRRRALVLLSDGEDTSSISGFDDVVERAHRLGATVYTVSLPGGRRPDQPQFLRRFNQARYQMRALATETGARAFALESAAGLQGAYQSIATELAHQYCLAYTSGTPRPAGHFTRVTVAVDQPDVRVRTRTGYISGGTTH